MDWMCRVNDSHEWPTIEKPTTTDRDSDHTVYDRGPRKSRMHQAELEEKIGI